MIILILVYFVIGGVATAIINKRKPEDSKSRWTKYFVYLVIVSLMLIVIQRGWFLGAAIIITSIGFYEIIRISKGRTVWIGLAVYMIISIFFLFFAARIPHVEKLFVYVTILTFDGFSQIVGQLLGKTKLAPSISPGKTVEGLAGGFLIAVATSYFISHTPVRGMIVCGAGLTGDLLASYYKRRCAVKDYSNLIPGHGGVLDRFDSLIFAGAVWQMIS